MTWPDVHYKKLTVPAWVECDYCYRGKVIDTSQPKHKGIMGTHLTPVSRRMEEKRNEAKALVVYLELLPSQYPLTTLRGLEIHRKRHE